MLLSHFPGFLTAYRSCDCREKKLVALDLGWLSEFRCTCLVVLRWLWQLGRKAFFVSCSLRPELCSNQCSLQSNRKKYPLGHELLLFHWISPRAKLTNFSSHHHPPTHFPNQTHCPHPQESLQLYYKQIYLSNF